jgi:hypothetical protein
MSATPHRQLMRLGKAESRLTVYSFSSGLQTIQLNCVPYRAIRLELLYCCVEQGL